eukprot:GEMP01038292.1.p1 GENE.GEMP01038292.1~~GEMP01038292.1.p1  ORF type:complete len:461 (-),score=123.40 GEMP01038292.1:471-1853(-)
MMDAAEIPAAEDSHTEESNVISGFHAKDGDSSDQKDDNRKRSSKSTLYKQECASLCLKNLTYNTSVDELYEFFKIAELNPDNIELHLDSKGEFRGTAFVTFADASEAAAALEQLGDSIELGGRRVKVETRRKGKRDRFASAREALVEILEPDEIDEVETAINEFMENADIRNINLPKDRAGKMEWSASMRKYAHALAEKKGLTHSTKATTENGEDADEPEEQRRRSVSVYLAKDRLSRQSMVELDPARKTEIATRESKRFSKKGAPPEQNKNGEARLSTPQSRRTQPARVPTETALTTITTSAVALARQSAAQKQQRASKQSTYEQGNGHARTTRATTNGKWNAEYAPKIPQNYAQFGLPVYDQEWIPGEWIQPTSQDSTYAYMAHQWVLASATAHAWQMYNAQLHHMLRYRSSVSGEETACDHEQEERDAEWQEHQRNSAKWTADCHSVRKDPSDIVYQ